MPEEQESLERAILGALRSQHRAHGPITPEWFGSAVKRIVSQFANAKLDGLARVMGRRRWAGVSDEARSKQMSEASKGRWASMSADDRSAEMKRRAKVRKAR